MDTLAHHGHGSAERRGIDAESCLGEEMDRPSGELVVIELLHVVRVHPSELLDVERGGVARHASQVEASDQLLARNDLAIIAGGPSQ